MPPQQIYQFIFDAGWGEFLKNSMWKDNFLQAQEGQKG